MTLIRWVLFAPAAVVAGVLAGAAGSYMADFMGEAAWFKWLVSGTLTGSAMVATGFRVAPRPTTGVKWILLTMVVVLGTLSAAGSLLGPEPVGAIGGAAMVAVGLGFRTLSARELGGSPESDNATTTDESNAASGAATPRRCKEPTSRWQTPRWLLVVPAGLVGYAVAHAVCTLVFSAVHGSQVVERLWAATDMAGMSLLGTYIVGATRFAAGAASTWMAAMVAPARNLAVARVWCVLLAGVMAVLLGYILTFTPASLSLEDWYRLGVEAVSLLGGSWIVGHLFRRDEVSPQRQG